MVIFLPIWVFVSFLAAQQIIIFILWLLNWMRVPISSLNETVLTTVLAAFIYVITIGLVIGLPWIIKKRRVTAEEIGLQRLPLWRDILMAPAGLVVYLVISAVFMLAVTAIFPAFDPNQHQDTGFSSITEQYQLILAFITLVVIAPVAEEVLFRGYLFGKLRKIVPVWLAIVVTSILFAAIHGAWNLAIDTFALSVVLCLLRISTGSIWASMLLHMAKNGIAFYILFVDPILHSTIGG
jgi:membrane protease YdiL (CAAX protease family)